VRLPKYRVLGSTALGFGAALVVAGCGAGQITQTNTQQAAVNGAYGQAGTIVIRDAAVVNRDSCEQAYPQGSTAPLRLWLVNQGAKDDLLLSVNSELASNAVVGGDKALTAGRTLAVGPAATPASPSSSTASSGASTSASSPSNVSPTSPAGTTSANAGTAQGLGEGSVALQGLKQAIWPGQTVKVTFVFRDAGPVTVDLPVAAPTKPLNCEVHTEVAPGQ
jgi:copper(I)-binding protein